MFNVRVFNAYVCSFFIALSLMSSRVYSLDLIPIPNTQSAVGVTGKVHLDVLINSDDMANKTAFSPATIPTTGHSGNAETTMSAGQSKLSIHTETQTSDKTVKTLIEWDWYNTDNSPAPHMTQLWGEYGNWGGGQTFSVFMDVSTFPDTLEYFGPNSMVFVRQPQLRFTLPLSQGQNLAFAVEKPVSAVTLTGSAQRGHETLPDLTMHWRYAKATSHIQLAGIIRQLAVEDANQDLETAVGFGLNVTANWQINEKNKISAAAVAGRGIGRYINDTSFTESDAVVDVDGTLKALPVYGLYGFFSHHWTEKASSSVGYGYLEQENEAVQADDAFGSSHFAVVNYLYQLAKPVQIGTELQWGEMEDKAGNTGDNLRWQSSIIFRF